jgi:hypothetical protein
VVRGNQRVRMKFRASVKEKEKKIHETKTRKKEK